MALTFWVQLVLAGIVGILALIDASASAGTTSATIAFLCHRRLHSPRKRRLKIPQVNVPARF